MHDLISTISVSPSFARPNNVALNTRDTTFNRAETALKDIDRVDKCTSGSAKSCTISSIKKRQVHRIPSAVILAFFSSIF